jgi:predicted GNAT family acetyltransferase
MDFVSSLPTATDIRPVMYSTFKVGGARTRKQRKDQHGGFSPSIMGGFIPNAQAAIVPAALYLVYHTFVPKGAKGKGVLRSLTRKATAGLKRLVRK